MKEIREIGKGKMDHLNKEVTVIPINKNRVRFENENFERFIYKRKYNNISFENEDKRYSLAFDTKKKLKNLNYFYQKRKKTECRRND